MADKLLSTGGAGDWDSANTWSGDPKPANNDRAICPTGLDLDIVTGHTDENGVDLDLFQTSPGFLGDIGSSGNALYISADKMILRGSGNNWIKIGDAVTDLIIVDTLRTATTEIEVTSGEVLTRLLLLRGNVVVTGANGTIGTLVVHYHSSINTDVSLTINSGAGTTTVYIQNGGIVTAHNVFTGATVHAGTLTKETNTVTNLLDIPGGTVIFKPAATIGTVQVAGKLDLTQSTNAKTLSESYLLPGGELVFDDLTAFTVPLIDATFGVKT